MNTIVGALRSYFLSPAHACLEEVRSTTGMDPGRFCDLLVVSLYPSRGVWFGGVEVKTARSDWVRELKDPTKAESIATYCDYWWVATPPGLITREELPVNWGWISVDPKRAKPCKVEKVAPKLPSSPPTVGFVASVLRNYEQTIAMAFERGREARRVEETETGRQLRSREDALCAKELALIQLERDASNFKSLSNAVREFESMTGLSVMHRNPNALKDIKARLDAAGAIGRCNLDALRHAADLLEKALGRS